MRRQRGGRVPWAELLRRVFAADVLACPCGGRRRVLAVVVDSAIARTLLAALAPTMRRGDLRAGAGPIDQAASDPISKCAR